MLFPEGLKATLEISPLCPMSWPMPDPELTRYILPVLLAETVTNLVP